MREKNIKGVSYETIYRGERNGCKIKFLKSVPSGTLWWEKHKDEKVIQKTYKRVTDLKDIEQIENRSVNWDEPYIGEKYYIFVQKNAKGEGLGNIKIVDKNNFDFIERMEILKGNIGIIESSDCIYYKLHKKEVKK